MDQLPNLLHELSSESDLPSAISRLLKSAALLINCDRATLFLLDRTEAPGFLYIGLSKGLLRVSSAAHHRRLAAVRIPIDRSSIAGFVAATGEAALIKDAYSDPRFDRRVDASTGYRTTSVLCVPLKDAHGTVVAVLQAVNKLPRAAGSHAAAAAEPSPAVHAPPSAASSSGATVGPDAPAAAGGDGTDGSAAADAPAFTEEDKALLGAVADVAGSILHQLTLQAVAARERARNEQMIALVRQISAASTTTRLGDVVDAVIDGTYRLLAVQRVTLYLLDDTRRNLVIASSQDAEGVRVPLSTGLAGHCARYGVPVVVADAYADSRFDRSVDASVGAAVGFKTQSVVCVPIRDPDGDVVGVLQAINRMASGSSPFDTDGDFAPPVAAVDAKPTAASGGAGTAALTSAAAAAAAALTLTSARSVDSAADSSTSGSLRGRTSTGAAGRSHNKLLALIDDGSDADHQHHHDAPSSSSATASPRVPPTPLPVPGTSGRGSFGFDGFGSATASISSSSIGGGGGSGGGSGVRGGSAVFFGTYNKPPAPAPSAGTLALASSVSTSSAAGAGARPSDGDADAEPLPIWPFTASDVQLLEGMAAHTAVALRTAQLLEGMARGQRMTAALLDIVQSSATNKPMSALVEQIVAAAYTLLDCERVSLYLVDSVKQELWMAVAKDSDAVGTRIPIGHGLAGYVAATGQPLNIPDAYSDSRFDPTLDMASGFTTKSVLVWPIAIADLMSGASSSGGGGAGGSALQRTASRRKAGGGGGGAGGATGAAVPSSSVIAVLQAINKRASSLTRVATAASLLRAQAGLPSAAAAAAADAAAAAAAHLKLSTAAREMRAIIPSAEGTSTRFAKPPTPSAGAGAPSASSAAGGAAASGIRGGTAATASEALVPAGVSSSGSGISRFDANDEKMMGAFCAEVSVALKRRSVEAAFMKVLSDSASAGGSVVTGVPEEFNVSLLALYTDAGTSARLHTSVQVRRMSVERSIAPLPTAPLALPSSVAGSAGPAGAVVGTASDSGSGSAAVTLDGSSPAADGTSPAAATDSAAAAASSLARKPAVRASFTARKALLAADADGVGVASTAADAAGASGSPSATAALSAASTSPALAASSSAGAGLPGDLVSSDPLLTWDWNVFALPLTGMPSLLLDPVMHAGELTTLARGATLPDGGLGADGAPMHLTHGCLTDHMQPHVVAAGELRLAAAVPAMFRQFALLRRFGIDETKFAAFTRAVRRKYHPNPFHNYYHAVSVLHAVFLILGTTPAAEMLTYRDILAALIAAYGHDVDHPGHNNAFEVNSLSPLALAHNDDAVLERHHAHTLSTILFDPKCAILSSLPPTELRACRATIVKAILGTDMTKHFGHVAELAERFSRHSEAVRARREAQMKERGQQQAQQPHGAVGQHAGQQHGDATSDGASARSSTSSTATAPIVAATAASIAAAAAAAASSTTAASSSTTAAPRPRPVLKRRDTGLPPSLRSSKLSSSDEAAKAGAGAGAGKPAGMSAFHEGDEDGDSDADAPASAGHGDDADAPHGFAEDGSDDDNVDNEDAFSAEEAHTHGSGSDAEGGASDAEDSHAAAAAPAAPPDAGADGTTASAALKRARSSAATVEGGGGAHSTPAVAGRMHARAAHARLSSSNRAHSQRTGLVAPAAGSSTAAAASGAAADTGSSSGAATAVPKITVTPAAGGGLPLSVSAASASASAAAAGGAGSGAGAAALSPLSPSSATSASDAFPPLMPFDRDSAADRNELVATLVHTADLSGQAYPAAVSRNWNARILAEFRSQAGKERALGLPVAPFMASLDTPIACTRLQLSFVSNIVLPLWQRVADLLPGMEEPLLNLAASRTMFDAEIMRWERERERAAALASAAAAAANAAAAGGGGVRDGVAATTSGSGAGSGGAAAPAAAAAAPPPPPPPPSAPIVPPRYQPPSTILRGTSIDGDSDGGESDGSGDEGGADSEAAAESPA